MSKTKLIKKFHTPLKLLNEMATKHLANTYLPFKVLKEEDVHIYWIFQGNHGRKNGITQEHNFLSIFIMRRWFEQFLTIVAVNIANGHQTILINGQVLDKWCIFL